MMSKNSYDIYIPERKCFITKGTFKVTNESSDSLKFYGEKLFDAYENKCRECERLQAEIIRLMSK